MPLSPVLWTWTQGGVHDKVLVCMQLLLNRRLGLQASIFHQIGHSRMSNRGIGKLYLAKSIGCLQGVLLLKRRSWTRTFSLFRWAN